MHHKSLSEVLCDEKKKKKKKQRQQSTVHQTPRHSSPPNQSIHNQSSATLVSLGVGGVLKVVHEHGKENLREKAIGVESNAVNIAEVVVELDLGHVGSELKQGLLEVSLLGSDLLAVAVTVDLDRARQRHAGESLLGGDDAAVVEGLEVEVGGVAVVVVGAELGLLVSEVLVSSTLVHCLPRACLQG